MNAINSLPACSKCRAEIPPVNYNRSEFGKCPGCGAQVRVEAFAALFRPPAKPATGELVMMEGESVCFYHENKKAAAVCETCGRFMCGLCDCLIHGRHLCPGCLESGKQKKTIETLDAVRTLHGYRALWCAVLPFFITGLAAVLIAWRHWKTPGSLVSRNHRWQMPTALVLGSLQTIGFVALFYAAWKS